MQGILFFCFFTISAIGFSSANENELDKGISLAVDARYEEALSVFRKLHREKPDDPLLNYYVGITYLRLKNLENAIAYLRRAVQEKASFPQAYFLLGRAYQKKKMRDKARTVVEKGIRRFPRNPRLRQLLEEITHALREER